MANTIIWDNPVIRATLSTDTAAEILAVTSGGTIVKRPAIDTSGFLSSTLTSARVFVGNSSNVATGVPFSGVIAITDAGLTSIVDGSILDADVNANAAIAVTKLAATTPSRALVSDTNGFIAASAVTATELGRVAGVTSAIQTQINGKLSATLTTPAVGDILYYDGATYVNLPITGVTEGWQLRVDTGLPAWGPPTPPDIPAGGTADQYLNKIDGTDFNTQWSTLTVAKVTDLTASAAELNILDGATLTVTELNFVDGVTSPIQDQLDAKEDTITGAASSVVSSNLTADTVVIVDGSGKLSDSNTLGVTATELGWLNGVTALIQTQLDNKLDNTLAHNAIWVGNGSNEPTPVAGGTATYVLTMVGTTPAWAPSTGGVSGLTTNRVPYATSATTLGDDAGLTWDATNNAMTIGTAMRVHSYGTDNIFIGEGAGNFTLTTQQRNIAIGKNTGAALTATGFSNVMVGHFAGDAVTNGGRNTAIGDGAMSALTGAADVVAVGNSALTLATGSDNTAVGSSAGAAVTSGTGNTLIGYQAGDNITTGGNNVILGASIDAQSATTNGQLSIQNAVFGRNNIATGTTISDGIIGFYSTQDVGSWDRAVFFGNMAVEGSAITDGVVVYAKNSSDGSANSTLGLYCEQAVEAIGTFTASHKLKIWINGVEYWIQLDAV